MIGLTIILAAILAQPPAPDPEAAAIDHLEAVLEAVSIAKAWPTRGDLEMIRATEDFVRATPGAAPPEPFRTFIRMAGAPCYSCRQIASKRLQRASGHDPRWLFWGMRDRDPERRLRCYNVLIRLYPCPACGGAGRAASPHEVFDHETERFYEDPRCPSCYGTRGVWVRPFGD